jgi:CheY-like chemotaxis protein
MARAHPLRILLAEDNVVNQKLALRLLQQMGYAPTSRQRHRGGRIGRAPALRRGADDVQMPEMDGLEASRRITRQMAGRRAPRIVAMDRNAMQGDREHVPRGGNG